MRIGVCFASTAFSGDHKNHEICAIDKAAKQERDGLTKKFQHAQLLKDMLGASI